jgi:hypothetical protein
MRLVTLSIRASAQGGLAGVTGWSVVFPFDTIKSVAQTGALPGAPAGMPHTAAAPPAFDVAARAVLAHGGVKSLYRGWSAAVMRAFPANAALLWGVHTAERLFNDLGGLSS